MWLGDIPNNFNLGNKIEEKSSQDSLLNKIVTFLIAITPPLILIFIPQEALKSRKISQDIILLIAISWLLVLIDKILKLGIIDSIVNIAKGIKDLNK